MSYIELGVRIPAELESDEVKSLLREHPEMTRAEAWAKVIERVVGAWPDVTILKDPSSGDMATYLRGYLPRDPGDDFPGEPGDD